ncbi:DEAD/DEAH box helicase [Paenibacillus xylanexedens]|uniref:DEAD/DEAH box helicase n=1 Tax=Paenibacillus xylanexedens TaxID=528191 RepID=UPI0011A53E9E|nr:DEAD/DEAH box helicase [Paenibacillus xylanexedens]
MIYADRVTGWDGTGAFIRVQFKSHEVYDKSMARVTGARFNPSLKVWAVPWSSLDDFEDKMGDHLIIWTDESNPTKGGIDEELFSDQPDMPGYSVEYDANQNVVSAEGFKTKPFGEFQVRGFNCLLARRFLILADDPGLGKTWQVANAISARKQQGSLKRGIVLVKASLLYNWRDEIHMHTNEKAVVVSGTPDKRVKLYNSLVHDDDWTFLVMSYEAYRTDVNSLQLLDNMKSLDFIILDEAHKIKNSDSSIGDKVHAIPFRFRYILTATPLPNSPLESFNYLKLGKVLPDDLYWYKAFENHFAIMGGFGNKEVKAYKNMRQLKQLIQSNMLRRTKKDKLKDLPDVATRKVLVTMDSKQRKLYDAVRKSILEDLKDTTLEKVPTALAKLMRLQQVTDSPALIGDEKTKSAKLTALDELLEHLIEESGQKVIVFSRFRSMAEVMEERYAKYNPAIIHGDIDSGGKSERTAMKLIRENEPNFDQLTHKEQQKMVEKYAASDRQKQVYEFQGNKDCKLFIGCAPACREGLTLTAATHVVFLDCEWSPAYVEQAYSRAHRIGQLNAVTVHYLICEGTIDEHVQAVLERKEAIAQAMIDEGIDAVGAMQAKELIETLINGRAA